METKGCQKVATDAKWMTTEASCLVVGNINSTETN